MKTLILLTAVALMGCAGMTTNTNMSPEQLKAIASDKNATAVCSTVAGMGGVGKVVVVNLDKSTITDGSITVDDNCKVTVTSSTPPKAAPVPKPASP